MKTKLIILTAAVLLTGCTTFEQRMAVYSNTCAGYGFEPGTVEFTQCKAAEERAYLNRAATRRAAAMYGGGGGSAPNAMSHGMGGCTPNVSTGGCL